MKILWARGFTLGLTMALATAMPPAALAQASNSTCQPGPCNVTARVYREGNAWVQEVTGTIAAGKMLSVQSALGSVQVHGAAQPNVTYTIKKKVFRGGEEQARHDMSRLVENVRRRGEMVAIELEWAGDHANRMSVEISATVPKETAAAHIETMGGSVDVKGLAGKVDARTAGGSITLDDIGGNAAAETMGGSIWAGNIGGVATLETAGGSINIGSVGGHLSATTSGGSISVGSGQQNITLETAGGSISVKQCNGQLSASTAGGSIDIGTVGGAASLESAGGSIRMNGAKGIVRVRTASGGIRLTRLNSGLTAETMAGPIEAEFIAGKGEFSDSRLETTVGDIIVYLPSDLPVTIKAAIEMANGHMIRSQFDGVNVTTEGGTYGPKTIFADGKLNGGGPVLKLHTTNGNIELRKTSMESRK